MTKVVVDRKGQDDLGHEHIKGVFQSEALARVVGTF